MKIEIRWWDDEHEYEGEDPQWKAECHLISTAYEEMDRLSHFILNRLKKDKEEKLLLDDNADDDDNS